MGRKIQRWSNVAVKMSTNEGTGAVIVLDSLSQAAEAVGTKTGHGLVTGDYVWLSCTEGMVEVDNRMARVKSATTDTFVLEKFNTTLFQVSEAGKTTLRKVTFAVNLNSAASVQSGGSGFEFMDATTIHDGGKVSIPGDSNAATFTFGCFWNPSDPAQAACKLASDAQDQRAFFMQFGVGGPICVFVGYVGASLLPAGQARQAVTTDIALTMFGSPTYY